MSNEAQKSKPQVPESNSNVPKYNKWNPEKPKRYNSGVYLKGTRIS